MKIGYKKLTPFATEPTQGSEYSAGYDLYSANEHAITIPPHTTVKIGTGIALDMDVRDNLFVGIFARSGLATKKGLRPANCVGVCDADYRGEYIVPLHNDTDVEMVVEPKERIAQLIFLPFCPVTFVEQLDLSETERGEGGFGHSGSF